MDTRPKELIFLADDDADLLALVSKRLALAGYDVQTYRSGEALLEALTHTLPNAVCLDLKMPGLSGMDTLKRLKTHHRFLPVVMLTGDKCIESVVGAMQLGAYDYVTKPIDQTKLNLILRNAVESSRMSLRLAQLEREVERRGYPGLVGESEAMRALFRQMDQVAGSDITVCIQGESGTGKELVARAIHETSGRSSGPFVALNCAAIPEGLQESELFGHERGAFTGATARRRGQFELATGGTLFLDEVAELSPRLQAKLLRALQERRIQRVGGNEEIALDFRLITATHRNLGEEVRAGRFREDLYFRIVVFELQVPPLRERRSDIRLLARYLLSRMSNERPPVLSEEASILLEHYDWPGNIRQLENVMQHAFVSSDGKVIRPTDLPEWLQNGEEGMPSVAKRHDENEHEKHEAPPEAEADDGSERLSLRLTDLERWAIEKALKKAGGNVSRAVRTLGIGRTTLYRKLKEYGLSIERDEAADAPGPQG